MFYNNEQEDYRDIEDISLEDLAKKVGVDYEPPTNNQEEWATFSFLKGMQEFEDEVYASCFMYYITVMMTGWGISNTAEYVYFKDSMEDRILDIMEDVQKQHVQYGGTHVEAMRGFFQQVIDFFKSEGEDYEKAVYKYTAELTEENKQNIQKRGKIKDIIVEGLENTGEPVENKNPTTTITFVLTHTQHKAFEEIEGENTTEKVLRIIGGLE